MAYSLCSTLLIQDDLVLTKWLNIIDLQACTNYWISLYFIWHSDKGQRLINIMFSHLIEWTPKVTPSECNMNIHYHLHKKKFCSTLSHKSTLSRTWDAISGGMIGDGGPIIRSSPTMIVSSMVGCESTEKVEEKKRRAH